VPFQAVLQFLEKEAFTELILTLYILRNSGVLGGNNYFFQ